ncbi:cation:proton antiporter [Halorubellus sp. PRR65]|uniref:cation:proton antiporter n=1 Tax=Halorubellus sp. PRR65 TaxID=3098148 RepID=UPI002B26083F|nr:cation:proton antiporter [Halorubellus sp. PRR65]
MADLLLQAGIAITVLAVVGLLAHRFGQSVIPAYIVVGIVVGPNAPVVQGVSFNLLERYEFITLFAELGIVLLLFFIGLEFSVDRLLARRGEFARAGTVDFAANAGVGLAIALAFGFSPLEAAFVAGIVYISSSAIVTKTLVDLGWVADPEAEPVLGVLVFEDLVIAVYLAIVSAVATGAGDPVTSVGIALAFLAVLFAVARFGGPAAERVYAHESDEQFLLGVLGTLVLLGAAGLAAGVSEAVAAFFLGMAFSETSHVERIERVLSPARDLFAAVFFLSIGLQTDLGTVRGALALVAAAVVLSTASKLASGYYAGRTYGLDQRRSVRVAVALVARGEFSLVLAAIATSVGTGALGEEIPAFAVGYVLAMSLLGTTLMRYSDVVTDRLVPAN